MSRINLHTVVATHFAISSFYSMLSQQTYPYERIQKALGKFNLAPNMAYDMMQKSWTLQAHLRSSERFNDDVLWYASIHSIRSQYHHICNRSSTLPLARNPIDSLIRSLSTRAQVLLQPDLEAEVSAKRIRTRKGTSKKEPDFFMSRERMIELDWVCSCVCAALLHEDIFME